MVGFTHFKDTGERRTTGRLATCVPTGAHEVCMLESATRASGHLPVVPTGRPSLDAFPLDQRDLLGHALLVGGAASNRIRTADASLRPHQPLSGNSLERAELSPSCLSQWRITLPDPVLLAGFPPSARAPHGLPRLRRVGMVPIFSPGQAAALLRIGFDAGVGTWAFTPPLLRSSTLTIPSYPLLRGSLQIHSNRAPSAASLHLVLLTANLLRALRADHSFWSLAPSVRR